MTRYTFEKVQIKWSKRLPCPECGKKLARSRTFMQTINPWNAHPDGTPRTYEEIRQNVIAEARAWALVPETCTAHDGVRQYGSVDVGGGK